MADNITLNAGSGGAVIAADDIGPGVWYQRVKITYGVDGSATDVSDTNPLPIDDAGGSITVDNGGTFAVQATQAGTWNVGTVTAVTDITNTVTVDNGGTFAVQAAQSGSWSATVTGAAAENAAVSGNPVLVGGRYDSSARTLGNGDAGAIALNASGHVIADISAYVDGTATDDAAFTPGTGTGAVMFAFADEASADSVDEGDVGSVRMTLDRRLLVSDRSESAYRNIDANAEAAIKASAGTLNWIHAINTTNALAYVHLYNATTANVTPGTTTPDFTFPVPTTGTASQGAGFTIKLNHYFSTAITLVVTTTLDGSTGDPGTNGVIVNAGYV